MILRRIFLIVALILPTVQSAVAQSWNVWGSTPVFDGGRVMPLNTFSRQIVREICGTPRPYIVRDDSIIVQLNRVLEAQPARLPAETDTTEQFPFLIPGTDIFGDSRLTMADEAVQAQDSRDDAEPMIRGLNRARAELIIQRIKTLIPQNGRYFDANELVLSWIGEPEIWDYIPIFEAPENDFRTEVLDIPLQNDIKTTLNRVAVYQLEYSDRYQRRLVDIDRKRQQRGVTEVPIPYDRIAERIARAMIAYQEFTFHPRRHRPTRMLGILENMLDASAGRESSFASASESWTYLLSAGAAPELQAVDPHASDDALTRMHPTTRRWYELSQRIRLLHGAFDLTDSHGKQQAPSLRAVERQFEAILQLLDANIEESEALMERVYSGVVFRKKENEKTDAEILLPLLFKPGELDRNRESVGRIVLNYHYSIKKMHREIEAAYLALYDNGRSLRVVPLGSSLALGGPENTALGVQPWGSMQMLLYGGNDFIRRFFDPRFEFEAVREVGVTEEEEIARRAPELEMSRNLDRQPVLTAKPDGKDADEEEVSEAVQEEETEEKQWEKELFSGDDHLDFRTQSRSSASQPTLGPVGKVRSHFQTLVASYSTLVKEYANSRFNSAAFDLQSALRETAARSDTMRLGTLDEEHPATEEYLAKTAYPREGAVNAEYRYYRIAPFFWMWVFAACAVAVTVVSLLLGRWRKITVDDPERSVFRDAEPLDFTKSPEEYTLWGGIAFLVASIFVTFIGGVMRAWISGWAPVTNMYETVVLMAFCASLFGLWYALYPLIHPAMMMAWRYSSFPTVAQLKEILKPTTPVPPPQETDGEQAMRQAAEDFGLPGGMPIGMAPGANPEEDETRLEERKIKKTILWQSIFLIPRVLLMFVTFLLVVNLSYGEYAHEHGAFAAAAQMLKMSDLIDWLVVMASIVLIVWFVPHLVLTTLLFPVMLARPSAIASDQGVVTLVRREATVTGGGRSEMSSVFSGETGALGGMVDVSSKRWLSFARNQILDRKLFVIIAAAVALLAGLAANYNSGEFNPDIRPIVAVLRSNFWLTVHVIAIIVSYAAAMVAWGMATVALGDVIFGRYRYTDRPGKRPLIRMPAMSETFAPIIHKLLQIAVLLLIIGTVLGARWADYSWGQFWSWDPKEVWALITILFYVTVLHGRIAGYYGRVGVMVGALFGSIAVIFTWYGINFLFKGSVHSYGGGATSHATLFMACFIGLNLLWGCLALFRYGAVMFGREEQEEEPEPVSR